MNRPCSLFFSVLAVLLFIGCTHNENKAAPLNTQPETTVSPEQGGQENSGNDSAKDDQIANLPSQTMTPAQVASYKNLIITSLNEHPLNCIFDKKDTSFGEGLVPAFNLVESGSMKYNNDEVFIDFVGFAGSNNKMEFNVTYANGRANLIRYVGSLCISRGCRREDTAVCR